MSFLLDIFFVLIFAIIVIFSVERGFVRSVWSTVTVVGAFIAAYIFGPLLGNWICDTFILNSVTEYAFEVVERLISEQSGQYNLSQLFETLPEEFVQLIENCGADIDQLASDFSAALTIPKEGLYGFAESVALPISKTISNAIGVILIFIVATISLCLIGYLVKAIVKLPLIHQVNGFLGLILGIIEGFVIVWVLCVAIGIFAERGFMDPASVKVIDSLTDGSYIFRFFCNLSPVNFINIQ